MASKVASKMASKRAPKMASEMASKMAAKMVFEPRMASNMVEAAGRKTGVVLDLGHRSGH